MKIPGYRLEKKLGSGGMATVYLATQESLHRKVAFKVMAPHLAKTPGFAERFMREARIVAQMQHPHIVAVHDVAEFQGVYYLAMEYLTGGSLADRLKNKEVTPHTALIVTRDIADALNYAHQKNIVHRDIKPDNILFRESTGAAVLSDFGIAKALDAETQLTQMGSTVGTPKYMSPEQARGQKLDGRSDLYGLGVMLFEMLTGKPPYTAEDPVALAVKHLQDPIPVLPEALQRYQILINKLMAKEPGDRFPNGAEVVQTINLLLNPANRSTTAAASLAPTQRQPVPPVANGAPATPAQAFFENTESESGNWFTRKYSQEIRFSADDYDEFRSRLLQAQDVLRDWTSKRGKKIEKLHFDIQAHPWIHGRIEEVMRKGRQENTPLGELLSRIPVTVRVWDDQAPQGKEFILSEEGSGR